MSSEKFCESFGEVAALGLALGIGPGQWAKPGCWEHRIDEHWEISMNGNKGTRKDSKGAEVSGFSVLVWFNGFPAGEIGPFDGIIAAGELANEDTFIAAVRKAALVVKEGA